MLFIDFLAAAITFSDSHFIYYGMQVTLYLGLSPNGNQYNIVSYIKLLDLETTEIKNPLDFPYETDLLNPVVF